MSNLQIKKQKTISFIDEKKDILISKSRSGYHQSTRYIKKYPLRSFFITLALLLLLLIIGRFINRTPDTITQEPPTKNVTVYKISGFPKASFQAKVEKTGIVKIVAQSAGVVQNIPVKNGDQVTKGQVLVSLASNYNGGNAPALQSAIAQKQYQNTVDTYGTQMDSIAKQREVADKTAENAEEMRNIAESTANDTRDQLNDLTSKSEALDKQIEAVKANLSTQQAPVPSGTISPQEQLAQLEAQKMQLTASINQLRAAQRNTEYQANDNKPPAELAQLQKGLTLNQLDVQKKSLETGKEVARLQSALAYISASVMYPVSPFDGTVDKINVKVGQVVNPGTVLATITSNDVTTTATALVPQAVAQQIATGEQSEIIINGKKVPATPTHVSTQATDGQLYSVYYDIPADEQNYVSDGDYVSVNIPIGEIREITTKPPTDPLIPIDAIYVTQDNAQLLVVKNGKAETRTVTLGKVYGSFVEVFTGISDTDLVIMERNVVAGDKVAIKHTY